MLIRIVKHYFNVYTKCRNVNKNNKSASNVMNKALLSFGVLPKRSKKSYLRIDNVYFHHHPPSM